MPSQLANCCRQASLKVLGSRRQLRTQLPSSTSPGPAWTTHLQLRRWETPPGVVMVGVTLNSSTTLCPLGHSSIRVGTPAKPTQGMPLPGPRSPFGAIPCTLVHRKHIITAPGELQPTWALQPGC